MDTIIFDLEADALLDNASTIWCGTFLQNGCLISFSSDNKRKDYNTAMIEYIDYNVNKNNYFIGHNIIQYDVPLIKKLLDYTIPNNLCIDTLILSKMFFPDINFIGNSKHGLEAWGTRLGILKPKHEDWSQFSSEMLHRNQEDVKINERLFNLFLKKGFNIPKNNEYKLV